MLPPLRNRRFQRVLRGRFAGILDLYPGAAAAYSLERLAADTSNVVRVRRSSDDTEQDFTAAQVSDGALTTFTGAGDGFVTTWYDQSGNGRNATQATAANQPQIVSAGSLVTENGKPSLGFDGTNDSLAMSLTDSQPATIITAYKSLTTPNEGAIFDGLNTADRYLFDSNVGQWRINAGASITGGTRDANFNLASLIYNTTSSSIHVNGAFIVSGNAGSASIGGLRIGTNGLEVDYLSGSISVLVVYPNNQSANRAAIEAKLAEIYGIPIYAPESTTYFTAAESLDPDAFDQTAVDPTQTEEVNKGQIDTVVRGLKDASLWTPLVEAWWFRDTSFTAAPVKLKYESDDTLTLNNYVSGDYLSEGTDPGLLGDNSTKTETTSYSATVTGSIAVFTSNGSFYGECSIPTAYTSSQYNLGRKECLFIFNRALTAGERTSLETIMVNQGARPFGLKAGVTSLQNSFRWPILTSFEFSGTGAVTQFFIAWADSGLKSFPLLDTSSGMYFQGTWIRCSLESFPLIDINNGKVFLQAWQDNSSLTSFPANFFDTWNPASIDSEVFNRTWEGCTSLTSTSVENILTSLDTSGKYGTNDGTSTGTVLADNTIDIDYDGSGLTAATDTAITNLKAKDWQVNINGVLK